MRRGVRALVLLTLVVGGSAIALAGAEPQTYRTVSEVVDGAEGLDGRTVSVKATLKTGSLNTTGEPVTFLLTDGANDLLVTWTDPLPEHDAGGNLEGRTVAMTGVLVVDGTGDVVLEGESMQVGCASKYRPEEGAGAGA